MANQGGTMNSPYGQGGHPQSMQGMSYGMQGGQSAPQQGSMAAGQYDVQVPGPAGQYGGPYGPPTGSYAAQPSSGMLSAPFGGMPQAMMPGQMGGQPGQFEGVRAPETFGMPTYADESDGY